MFKCKGKKDNDKGTHRVVDQRLWTVGARGRHSIAVLEQSRQVGATGTNENNEFVFLNQSGNGYTLISTTATTSADSWTKISLMGFLEEFFDSTPGRLSNQSQEPWIPCNRARFTGFFEVQPKLTNQLWATKKTTAGKVLKL